MLFRVVVLLLLVSASSGFVVSSTSSSSSSLTNKERRSSTSLSVLQDHRTSFTELKTSNADFFAATKLKGWEKGIYAAEMELKRAMLHSDVAALDQLLDDELLFVNHFDQVMTKGDDLDAYCRRMVELESITLSNWNVEVVAVNERPHLALVTVDAHIVGALGGLFFEDDLRFHRVWKRKAGRFWQVVEGDSSLIIKD